MFRNPHASNRGRLKRSRALDCRLGSALWIPTDQREAQFMSEDAGSFTWV